MTDDAWLIDARVRAAEALQALSPEGAMLERQLRRWLLGTPRDPAKPPRDPRVLTRARIRATRTTPNGTIDLIDVLLFLHAIDADAEPRRDDILALWRPYVAATLDGGEPSNPLLEHPGMSAGTRGLVALFASMRHYFRTGLYWWERSGIPRRWLVQAKGASSLRLARYVLTRFGGFRPTLASHLPQLPPGVHLTEDMFVHAHMEIARVLLRSPEILGIVSASWYYDPALAGVSPNLGFAHRIVSENGGLVFEVPADAATKESALAASRGRREAEAQGRYRPGNFARVWGRDAVVAWARRQTGWQYSLAIGS